MCNPGNLRVTILNVTIHKRFTNGREFPDSCKNYSKFAVFCQIFFSFEGRFLKSALTPMKTADCATDSTST